uniref:uncharacterized protein LOC120327927 n=1 Tax=Styela clava TaxID=7725 RepID=UPI00193AB8AF|nr:uncharacterized protein LOC120327927 [Styela clava]
MEIRFPIIIATVIVTSLQCSYGITFDGERPKPDGTGPNICGAIISQCMHRCKSRESDGNLGTEYVQLTINFLTSETTCITSETEVNELVSANPPNSDKSVVVFNVPCCQQRPYQIPATKSTTTTIQPVSVVDTRSTMTLNDRAITPNTVSKESSVVTTTLSPTTSSTTRLSPSLSTTTTSTKVNNTPGTGKVTGDPTKTKAWDDMLLLVVTILCFVLLLLILGIMLYKIMKKRRRRKNLKNASTGSPATSTTLNGAVLTGISNEKRQEKSAMEVISKVVKSIPPPDDYYEGPELLGSGYMTPLQRDPNTDYIVLDTMTTPPKSRSSRGRGQDEVLIVGTGRKNKHRNENTIQYIPNGHAGGYYKGNSLSNTNNTQSPKVVSTGTWSATTVRPQLPERNFEAINQKRRSDSLPQNFMGPTGEVEYDKVASDMANITQDERERVRAQTVAASGAERKNGQFDQNVYNTLREEKKGQVGDVYDLLRDEKKVQEEGDYQRLNRVDSRANGSFSEEKKLSPLPKSQKSDSFDENEEIENENKQESEYQRLNIAEHTTVDTYNHIDNLTESPPKSRSTSLEDDYVQEFQIMKKKRSLPDGEEQIIYPGSGDPENNNSDDETKQLTSPYENSSRQKFRKPVNFTNNHNNPILSIKLKKKGNENYMDRIDSVSALESEDL